MSVVRTFLALSLLDNVYPQGNIEKTSFVIRRRAKLDFSAAWQSLSFPSLVILNVNFFSLLYEFLLVCNLQFNLKCDRISNGLFTILSCQNSGSKHV